MIPLAITGARLEHALEEAAILWLEFRAGVDTKADD
jgi:hypothetical protein